MESRMIYICSPYAGNTEENIAFARQACGYAIRQGAVPLAPHLLYPQILNDSVPEERETGIRLGLEMLERCEELWICGDRMSAGMKRETAYAKARGIPVRRIPVCEIMGNQTVQEMGEAIREGPETSQSHQKDVQFGM